MRLCKLYFRIGLLSYRIQFRIVFGLGHSLLVKKVISLREIIDENYRYNKETGLYEKIP